MSKSTPKHLVAGCYTYKIIRSKAKVGSTHGETNLDNKEIVIFHTDNQEALKETLLHEILHVALEDIVPAIASMEVKDDDKEEQLVRLLSPRLMQIFRDNKEVREYIWKKGK